MKSLIACLTLIFACSAVARDVYVQGHYRKDGTYVQGYYRTSPDQTTSNNYSTRGNVNPYTGEEGTKPSTDGYSTPGSSSSSSSYNCHYVTVGGGYNQNGEYIPGTTKYVCN